MRRSVRRFGEAMESVLKENDHKDGWDSCTRAYLLSRLFDEFSEVVEVATKNDPVLEFLCRHMQSRAVLGTSFDRESLRKELVDVANLCMMLHESLESK